MPDCSGQVALITEQHEAIAALLTVVVALCSTFVVWTRRNGSK